jgi:hypothetical protein
MSKDPHNEAIERALHDLEPICKQADEYQKGHGYPVDTPAIELAKYALERLLTEERKRVVEKVKKLGVRRKLKIAETEYALKQVRKTQPELTMQDLKEHNAEAEGYDNGYAEAMEYVVNSLTQQDHER